MKSPNEKRNDMMGEFRKNGMDELGATKIWYALSYRLLTDFDQENLHWQIMSTLKEFGICPTCLQAMDTGRRGDAAGGMENYFKCDKCGVEG